MPVSDLYSFHGHWESNSWNHSRWYIENNTPLGPTTIIVWHWVPIFIKKVTSIQVVGDNYWKNTLNKKPKYVMVMKNTFDSNVSKLKICYSSSHLHLTLGEFWRGSVSSVEFLKRNLSKWINKRMSHSYQYSK